ncbi:DUF4439 domain-containing protein [Aestuariimicrobium soli]|uniref:DUF4439 domain-containing protein n=1 Tax=Aestuariimicrobium soli TaxID=2035834 RepID=UPI003EBF0E01
MPTRRSVLASGLLATTALTLTGLTGGCSWFDPTIRGDGDPGGSPTPSPTPGADQLTAVAWLNEVSRALAALRSATGATAAQQAWARGCQQALGLQSSVLRRPDPLVGDLPEPVAAPPTIAPAPVPVAQALTTLGTVATARAADLAALADRADAGAHALLWGSVSIFVGSCARPAAHPPVNQNLLPYRFDAETLEHAQGVLIQQLFRAEQAASALVGALSSGELRTSLQARRTGLAALRVETQNEMRANGATPPPPEPGYDLPERPTANNAGVIMAAVETDVANALAGVYCSTSPTTQNGRSAARARWSAQMTQATRWGPTSWFPGWV